MQDFVFLSGTSNKPLATKISHALSTPLGEIDITRFMDNECRVYVKENVTGKDVIVLQSLSEVADQNLVELCLIGQALKTLKCKKSVAVIPWLGYSKQDKAFRPGESVSSQLVAKFIEAAGFDYVLTVDLHSENLIPYFSIPVVEVSAHTILADKVKHLTGMKVVSPDMGGKGRSERFARELGLPIVYLTKKRNLETGAVTVSGLSEPVTGERLIIFDDIINTSATAIRSSEYLKHHGAKEIYVLATHGVMAGDAARQLSKSTVDHIIVTDSIHIPKEKHLPNLEIVSLAPLLLKAIEDIAL